MTSLLSIPSAQQTTAAVFHDKVHDEVQARSEQYNVASMNVATNNSVRCVMYATASEFSGCASQTSVTIAAAASAQSATRGANRGVRSVRRTAPHTSNP